MLLLLPGIGPQAGDLEASVQAAINNRGEGFLINASRSILYAKGGDTYAARARQAAITLRNRINLIREAVLAGRPGGSASGR